MVPALTMDSMTALSDRDLRKGAKIQIGAGMIRPKAIRKKIPKGRSGTEKMTCDMPGFAANNLSE